MAAPAISVSAVTAENDSTSKGNLAALAVLTSLFFMWGFLTCLNDIIIPHFKAAFDLTYAKAMLVQFAFFTAFFVVSLPAGWLVGRFGYKLGIVLGLMLAASGCFLFFPAAAVRNYNMFLAALFILASGITLLQVAANPYVAILGPPQTASARLTMTQAFNSLATTLAPVFGARFILSHPVKPSEVLATLGPAEREAYRVAEAQAVQYPYLGLGLTLLVMAIAMALFKLPKLHAAQGSEATSARGSAWQYRHLVLGAIGIFAYVGGEVAIGSFLVNYLKEPHIAGFTEAQGAQYVSYYWGGAMIGRFIGMLTLRVWKPSRVLMVHALVVVALVTTTLLSTGTLAMVSVLGVGLFNSIMFPAIFTLALKDLGKHTSQGSGVLCMAIVGGAIIPYVQGTFADSFGVQLSFVVPIVCYAYVLWYAWRGYVPRGPALAAS